MNLTNTFFYIFIQVYPAHMVKKVTNFINSSFCNGFVLYVYSFMVITKNFIYRNVLYNKNFKLRLLFWYTFYHLLHIYTIQVGTTSFDGFLFWVDSLEASNKYTFVHKTQWNEELLCRILIYIFLFVARFFFYVWLQASEYLFIFFFVTFIMRANVIPEMKYIAKTSHRQQQYHLQQNYIRMDSICYRCLSQFIDQ